MDRILRFPTVVLLALAGLVGTNEARWPRHPMCSISVRPFHPAPTSTYFLGVALEDTMVAGEDTVRLTGAPGEWGWARRRRPVMGQLIELRGVGGAGASLIKSVVHPSTSTAALVVLWDYDSGCQATQWGRSARWAVVGSELFVEAILRPQNKWVAGHPTFDTFFAGQLAYPSSAVRVYRELQNRLDSTAGHSAPASDWLSAAQVFDLVDRLPAECDWYRQPQEAAARLATVKKERAAWLTHYPADGIIRVHENRADNPTSDPYLRHLCAA